MNKMYFNNGLRLQCLDVEELCMEQFRRSVASFHNLLPIEKIKSAKRIIASGAGDSFLAAAESKGAFARYLPDVHYEAPSGIEAGRYLEMEEEEPDTIMVGISVGGGTARVSEILQRGVKHGCCAIALTDNPNSLAAHSGNYLYHTNTPVGDNISGLRTYYVSMISLYVMAAAMGEIRTGKPFLKELEQQVEKYRNEFFRNISQMDDICFEKALAWREKKYFEVTADGQMFWCGRFLSAKMAELSGDVCSVIDSENYFHVNGILYPAEEIGEMNLVSGCDGNVDRIAETINSQVRAGRDAIVFSDLEPVRMGITQQVTWCPMAVPEKEYSFLLPLFAYIPGSILASYRATLMGEPFFRGGSGMPYMTLGSNPIQVI